MRPKLILASTSKYRSALLAQLGLPFQQIDPHYSETVKPQEKPEALAQRLAKDKAQAGAACYAKQHANEAIERTDPDPNTVIIGSDQVAYLGTRIFSKPGNLNQACQQLRACSGHWLSFSSAVCLVSLSGEVLAEGLDSYEIKYRDLSDSDIQHYLRHDEPFDCAGSIKAEGLGISLIEEGRGKDINTLYGLPLILLLDLLKKLHINNLEHIN